MKRSIVFWLILFLVISPAMGAYGQENSGPPPTGAPANNAYTPPTGAVIGDFLFVRPFGVVATAVGVVLMVASLPFSVPSRSVGVVAETLVADPFMFTFARPLGYFPSEPIWP